MSAQESIRDILARYRTVVVVGISRSPAKDSYRVAKHLQERGYNVVPVNPFADEVLGRKCYKSLKDIPESLQKKIEIVDIFRPSEDIPPIVDQAIHLKRKYGKPCVVWMQLGIVNEVAAGKARRAGMTVVMDRCMMVESKKLESEKDIELEGIRARKLEELKSRMKKEAVKSSLTVPITLDDAHFDQTVQQHPLMLIDCWAAWCGPCRMVAPVIDELARDYAGRVIVGKLNVDENPKTAARFGIMSIPTLLILREGREVDRMIGALPRKAIEERLRKHL